MYKKYLRILALSLSVLGISYAAYKYYSYSSSHKEIAIIYPDLEVTKIKPLEPGGITIPNADNTIYESLRSQKITKKISMLPEPEQPIARNAPIIIDDNSSDSIDSIIEELLAEDKKPKIDRNLLEDDLLSSSNKTSAILINREEPSQNQEKINSPEIPSSTSNKTLNVVQVIERTNKLGKIKDFDPQAIGNYKIQLASVRSEAQGLAEGERIKKKYLKILVSSTISTKKVQRHKDQFFYAVLAGPYPSLGQAKATCKKLLSKQQQCMVINW